jgi:uncharacterized protein (DUF2236 family)
MVAGMKKAFRFIGIGLLAGAALMAVELSWYALGRVLAPLTAVSVRINPAVPFATNPFNGSVKIVTYNICHGRGTLELSGE